MFRRLRVRWRQRQARLTLEAQIPVEYLKEDWIERLEQAPVIEI